MVRQRYLNLFIEECLKFCSSNQEAIEKVGPGVQCTALSRQNRGPGHCGLELKPHPGSHPGISVQTDCLCYFLGGGRFFLASVP